MRFVNPASGVGMALIYNAQYNDRWDFWANWGGTEMSILRSPLHLHSILDESRVSSFNHHHHPHPSPSGMQLRFQPPTDLLCESLSRSLASTPTTSPYFSSDEEEDTSFFGRKYVDSPASHSDYEDEEEANDSDATLDDVDLDKFGSPLERIPPCERRDGAIALIAVDADHELVHEIIYHRGIPCSSDCPSPTLSSESSVTSSIT